MNVYEFIVKMKDYASSQLKNVANSVGVASRKAKDFIKDLVNVDKQSQKVASGLGSLKQAFLGVFAVATLQSFVGKVVEARAEFEKFDAVLTNTFQSEKIGSGALALLTEFAAKTPYQLNELTGGFIKLVNRGVYPTYQEMTKLGDLASSQGKSFDQMVEALLDAQTGEFERMKEFGIKASKDGDKVKLTFKGVTKEVANNEQAIKDAIIAYGGMKGVAGSMEVVSKTLGGQISNLEDQWWGFLVAVGSYGGGIFGDVLGGAADLLQILQDNLPLIAHWFDLLWQNIYPVVTAFKEFLKIAAEGVFGLSSSSDALGMFGDIMVSVLLAVNWFTTGLIGLINWLKPIAPYILDAAIAWGILNAVIAISPIGWIVIGIVALITVIGMAIKYTSGWGDSWHALKKIFQIVWEQIKADFNFGVLSFKTGFNLMILYAKDAAQTIVGIFSKVGDAIKMAMDGDFSGAFNKVTEKVKTEASGQIDALKKEYAKQTADYSKGTDNREKELVKAAGNIGITTNKESIANDFKKLKDSFKGLKGEQTGNSKDYLDAIPGLTGKGKPKEEDDDKKKKKKGDGITDGGNRLTNITININKLQDHTIINVDKTETGLSGLGDKVQEILLRAANSALQMQTG
ncbi:hypothetical protein [Epilithonimonas arachidiradicis]|uniref:Tape measure domain-containing protein n=1 Tax=Epilithonimonas arachidiradicis TaxID=1617282 RepID=A0A420DDK9_9FLAO|nr:hypothetical protein [Epilithonimonas arachidiradicis]RKE90005.1 hypothetical protein BXY58_0590 [Epilithonimonas arachidiradicis]GGG47022.1 hypothetical protein GCM10007332_05650 [Epilithonimonas arachidiradicis]